jgi:hypothetical protein
LQDERAKMAGTDIFISYKSERRKAAEHLAAVLTHYGYSVWFDYQLIKGSDFGLQIGRRIREARALVVLWCSRSVESRWVVEEAALGDRLGTLIPVVIEPCELPVGFQRQDYIDMSAWDGAPRGHQLDPLIDAVEQRTGRPAHLDLKGVRQFEDAWRRYGAPSLRDFALGQPVEDVVGERQMPHNGPSPVAAPTDHRHELMTFAAREWPDVRDSRDLERLASFEKHFAGTFYAGEARLLIERIRAERRVAAPPLNEAYLNENFSTWPTMAERHELAYVPPVMMAVAFDGTVHDATTLPADAVKYVTLADAAALPPGKQAYCVLDMGDCMLAVDSLGAYMASRSKRRLALACYFRPDADYLDPNAWAAGPYYECGYHKVESQYNIISPTSGAIVKRQLVTPFNATAKTGKRGHRVELAHKGLALVRAGFVTHNRRLPAWFEVGRAGMARLAPKAA